MDKGSVMVQGIQLTLSFLSGQPVLSVSIASAPAWVPVALFGIGVAALVACCVPNNAKCNCQKA